MIARVSIRKNPFMEDTQSYEQLPTGKTVFRHFWNGGIHGEEMHAYGVVEISITYSFHNGKKIGERYMVRKRLVSRKAYEKARPKYPDMPAADGSVEDVSGELLQMVAKERKASREEAKHHKQDPGEAAQTDAFCEILMEKGKTEDARQWIKDKNHTLGEMDWRASKRLVDRLFALGCVKLLACEIDVYDDGHENTGHLVVKLPKERSTRAKLFLTLDKLTEDAGYTPGQDDGQRYFYVKLD
jgi:hypothetical protein